MTVGRRIQTAHQTAEEIADTLTMENLEARFGASKRVGRLIIAKERGVRIEELRHKASIFRAIRLICTKLLRLSENPTDTDPFMECFIGRVQLRQTRKIYQKRNF